MSKVTASFGGGGGSFGVLVHGGAGKRAEPATEPEPETGCRAAAEAAREILRAGGTALDAVERAVTLLEDDPRYNAGLGAALTDSGEVELDASIMEGRGLRAGAVCVLRGHRNAVRVARAALEDGRHVFYAADGAARFAAQKGIEAVDPASLVTERQRKKLARFLARERVESMGTVGAVARDVHGDVAAATSTGGIVGQRAGRVGDSPVLGAGTYADNAAGAGSATGHGEGILRVTLTARAVAALRQGGEPSAVAAECLEYLASRVGSSGGLILVDARGALGLARTTERMPWAAAWDGGEDGGE
jgi:beta-aspartyl-peptidase (threonine type)